MLGTHDVRRVRHSEAEVHRPDGQFLSDKRVEAADNRAVKSITDNPADLERELRDFAQTGEG